MIGLPNGTDFTFARRWAPEGSLAGCFWRHEMVSELVYQADFWCNRHCRTSPLVLEEVEAVVWCKCRSSGPDAEAPVAFGHEINIS